MNGRTYEYMEMFEEDIGPVLESVKVPAASFDKYRQIMPDALMKFWEKLGWGTFAEGIFWIVNPERFDDLVELWLDATPFKDIDQYHVIARNAFGDLYVWGQNNNQYFTISCPLHAIIAQENKIRRKSDDPDLDICIFFSDAEKKNYDLKDENGNPLFDRALKKLGHLEADEIYGFKQPLFAGGHLMLENLIKVKLDQHLTLARELGGPPKTPFANFSIDI